MEQIKNSGQGRLFRNPVLEALTKTSPLITICTYTPVFAFLFYEAYNLRVVDTFWKGLAIFLFAVFFWTFFEYVMHRYVFHFITESPLVQKFHYMVHGVHHEYPRDQERLFMPPVPALLIVVILFAIFWLIMRQYVYVFLPGFLAGYLMYAFIHYAIHLPHPPRFLKSVYRHHSLHHYKYPDKAFGVSSPFWDYVFRTLPPQ